MGWFGRVMVPSARGVLRRPTRSGIGSQCRPLWSSSLSLTPPSRVMVNRISLLEGAIITWTKQIRNVLKQDSESQLKQVHFPLPQSYTQKHTDTSKALTSPYRTSLVQSREGLYLLTPLPIGSPLDSSLLLPPNSLWVWENKPPDPPPPSFVCVAAQGMHPTPDVEIEFWRNKGGNLNSIFDQLQSPKIRKVITHTH